jgi:xanthine phosphoribosyltransferase
MEELKKHIEQYGKNRGNGILFVPFLNHEIEPDFTCRMGEEFAKIFAALKPTKVLTAETSGIIPAFVAAKALKIPMIFARKNKPSSMSDDYYIDTMESRTYNKTTNVIVLKQFINPNDRILIIEDMLATGQSVNALARLTEKAGAHLVGVGVVVEKAFEEGRKNTTHLKVPIHSLACITSLDNGKIVFN